MALNFLFNAININSLQSNAGVFLGQNTQTGWMSPTKENNGIFGPGQGMILFGNVDYVFDNDVLDMPNLDPDVQPTFQGQTI